MQNLFKLLLNSSIACSLRGRDNFSTPVDKVRAPIFPMIRDFSRYIRELLVVLCSKANMVNKGVGYES
jgi:hypothetical protein